MITLTKEERAALLKAGRKVNKALEECSTMEAELSGNYPRLEKLFDKACDKYAELKGKILSTKKSAGIVGSSY
jgi:hypothetical protein